ncbi:NRPS-like protein biosynthetic cluster [Penicillium robsamsonii]|uniref:NRPS-like protein biosynthetic cluster n=1 Tax=Penicillium robsamsonii TaxID=1792511 RepID=UPI0025472A4B|nr:NRPS-like protein biosynthetic cluster [Penicillium robsamsonii]KAJ5834119.1 NRPS-like protein biosynthetic cluster [Penicillium robsamsonii]
MTVTLRFPNEPHFRVLLKHCEESPPDGVFFYDPSCGVEANHQQFLQDVYTTRQGLLNGLPRVLFNDQDMIHEERPFVCLLNQGNYEYIVAAFAVLILGGAVVPLAPSILPEEASHLMKQCQSAVLMAGSSAFDHATAIQQYAVSQQQDIHVRSISINNPQQPILPLIEETMIVSVERPSILVFTSGTVGPPKGVVHGRRLLALPYTSAQAGIYLNCISLWTVGAVRLVKHTLYARRIEIIRPDPGVLWERLRKGGVAFLAAGIPLWQGLMEYFQQHLDHLPAAQREEYLCGLRGLNTAMVTGGTLFPSRLRFWRDLGRPLQLCYGATELGRICLITKNGLGVNRNNYLGRPAKGTTIKLSEGDHGELLIKSPNVFTHYLNNPAATKAVFTDDGFYQTGDLVSREDDDYFFHGRASTDFIKYYGYQIPIPVLEKQLNELPGVREGYILAMPDERCGYRAAALIRLIQDPNADPQPATFDLPHLREQLADKMPAFMLPTALRFLQEETIPRSISGKILRRDAVREFFPVGENGCCSDATVQMWLARPSVCRMSANRVWDWAGAPM